MIEKDVKEPAAHCPLCGSENLCEQIKAQKKTQDEVDKGLSCWCMKVNLSNDARSSLKNSTNGNECLCQACILKFASPIECQ